MALTAPTVDIRTRIPESTIQVLIAQIAEQFQPEKIILFGSYAYGTPRPESDVDLLVIMNTPLRASQQAAEKYLKAVLQENGRSIPRIHSLAELLAMILKDDPSFLLIQNDLSVMENYAVQFRYPGLSADLD